MLKMMQTCRKATSDHLRRNVVTALQHALRDAGHDVGVAVRDPSRARMPPDVTVHRADMLEPESLARIGEGYGSAFYLVHSMGRGGGADYEQRDVDAAHNFARFAREAGIRQVVYLGGLGAPGSPHLRSRTRVGEILRDEGPRYDPALALLSYRLVLDLFARA